MEATRTRRQLEPFAISTERYEELITEAIALRSLTQCSTQRWRRTEGYAARVARRTGETREQVLARLAA